MLNDADLIDSFIDTLPIGVIYVDQGEFVQNANKFALALGVTLDEKASAMVHGDSLADFNKLLQGNSLELEIQLSSNIETNYAKISSFISDDQIILVVRDIGEEVALRTQLKNSKLPERKFIHDLSNAFTSAMGYSELISMLLDEEPPLTNEKLGIIKRYQDEVLLGLKRADMIIKTHKQSILSLTVAAVPLNRKHIMIIDDEPSITEFLSELMNAKHYKVSAFTSSTEALEFYRDHIEDIELVIMDQLMPEMNGITLATEMLALNINLPIVLCTGDDNLIMEQSSGKLNIEHFISKPIDINELTKIVSSIID